MRHEDAAQRLQKVVCGVDDGAGVDARDLKRVRVADANTDLIAGGTFVRSSDEDRPVARNRLLGD